VQVITANLAVLVEDRPRLGGHIPMVPAATFSRRISYWVPSKVLPPHKGAFLTFPLALTASSVSEKYRGICSSEAEIRHEVGQTVLHEIGHYFGMNEDQLKDV
jgi:Zincin-like metallopeptidase